MTVSLKKNLIKLYRYNKNGIKEYKVTFKIDFTKSFTKLFWIFT